MNNFSINRFAKTLWWVICVYARTLLLWCVAAITLVVFIGEILFQEMNSYADPWSAIHNFSQLAAGLFIIVSLIMISLFAFGINDKRKRATFLMLPSSNFEKFLSLVVFTTVIGIACLFLAIVLGDSLRMAWYWLSGYQGPRMECVEMDGVTYHWWSSAIPQLIKELAPEAITNPMELPMDWCIANGMLTFGLWLWLHSFYTLGGTLLRKYAFVATSICILLCLIILVKTMAFIGLGMFQISWEDGAVKEYEIGSMAYVLSVLLPIFAVFNYWASYRIFKGFQLITNKWMNYDIYKR